MSAFGGGDRWAAARNPVFGVALAVVVPSAVARAVCGCPRRSWWLASSAMTRVVSADAAGGPDEGVHSRTLSGVRRGVSCGESGCVSLERVRDVGVLPAPGEAALIGVSRGMARRRRRCAGCELSGVVSWGDLGRTVQSGAWEVVVAGTFTVTGVIGREPVNRPG